MGEGAVTADTNCCSLQLARPTPDSTATNSTAADDPDLDPISACGNGVTNISAGL